jgi:MshEN domain
MPRLGTILLRSGAVGEESVTRALAVQGFAGGRLGTLLIERGSASEDDIGKALSEQHGCPYIPWSVLGAVPGTVTAALPAKFAIRHSAVPVELGEGFIRIALRDPANLRILDELFFVTGKKILPAVAPEVRLYQALEKYYGERRTPRFAILAEKLSRPIAPSVIKKPLPPPPDFSINPRELPPGLASPEDASLIDAWRVPDEPPVGWGGLPQPPVSPHDEPETIAWEEVPPAPSWKGQPPPAPRGGPELPERVAPPPPPAPPPGAWRQTSPSPALPSAERPVALPGPPGGMPAPAELSRILAAGGRDEIFDAVLASFAKRFPKTAVFVARREGVAGWSGAGDRVDAEKLRRVELPWSEPSLFLNIRMSRSFYLGPLPPLPRHDELAEALGGWPSECLVQPVLMRDKTVAFFYAECPVGEGATPADLTFARELAGAAAAALAASIRLKKKQVI